MQRDKRRETGPDHEVALAALAWTLIASPAVALWAEPAHSWLAPYAVWAALIAGAWVLARRRGRHDH